MLDRNNKPTKQCSWDGIQVTGTKAAPILPPGTQLQAPVLVMNT